MADNQTELSPMQLAYRAIGLSLWRTRERALGTNENKDGICEEVTEFVDRLTGKQTIFQCIALNEAVVRRGGEHVDPGEYKKEYLRRLETRIADRKNGLENGCPSPAEV